MSTADLPTEADALEERPRLLSMEIGGWPGLAEDVRVPLDERCTLLVGKNGAGKSLLMEGMFWAARRALFAYDIKQTAPLRFRCEIARPGASAVTYEYRLDPEDAGVVSEDVGAELDALDFGEERRPRRRSWYERCWTSDGAELWKINEGMSTVRGRPADYFPLGMGLLSFEANPDEAFDDVTLVHGTLSGLKVVPASMPRTGIAPRGAVVSTGARSRRGVRRWSPGLGERRVEELARSILSTWESNRERHEEFAALLRELGLVHEIKVNLYEDPNGDANSKDRRDLAMVLFDGLNIGLQSDGTLRVAEIVHNLLRPGLTCLFVEEPELAVHPGMLDKLLSVIDSYVLDRQVVISTHSPQLVDWAKPQQIRLVEREQGVTRVRSFSGETVRLVNAYLADQGTLGDFVYRHSES